MTSTKAKLRLILLLALLCSVAGVSVTAQDTATVRVTTKTVFFKPEQLINELMKRPEIKAWGWRFVDKTAEAADINIELDHTLFTYKFSFKATKRTGAIMATGNVIVWDGNLGAPKMADRIIQKFKGGSGQTPGEVSKIAADQPVTTPTPAANSKPKTEAEIKKLLHDLQNDDANISNPADKELSSLDRSYLPLLKKLIVKAKACDGLRAAQVYLEINKNDNREIVPELVQLTTGGNLLSLFNLEQEFMCRRGAAYVLPLSADGVRALTKLLDKGDQWERETAIFAFDDFTETNDYDDPNIVDAMKEAIPAMGKGVRSKHQVISEMCNEVLSQIIRHSTPELQALAKQYYED
ncbi:MAG TPA: hypothetical protein VGO43_00700 [Pyrinomonadaceae bacterium]|nr:hypothetical protein [Pyrinomonadaceae bacterium]